MEDGQFRFEHMEIWRRGADLSGRLFSLAEQLDDRKFFRFAEAFRRSLKS